MCADLVLVDINTKSRMKLGVLDLMQHKEEKVG